MSHLSDIGFAFTKPEELFTFIEQVVNVPGNERLATFSGYYIVWQADGTGPELWIQAKHNLQLVGCALHFSGEGRTRFHVTQTETSPENSMDGTLYGWLNPSDETSPYSGDFPLLLASPDLEIVGAGVLEYPVVTVQIAAFVEVSLQCYPTEDADGDEDLADCFEPATESGDDAPGSTPHAHIRGRVVNFERRTNPATNLDFYWLLVTVPGGTVDMVVDPALVAETLSIGSIVEARCWLSAKVVSAFPRSIGLTPKVSGFRIRRLARANVRNQQNSGA